MIPGLTASELAALQTAGAQVVDLRAPGVYAQEHIPEALNLPFEPPHFAHLASQFLHRDAEVALIADDDATAGLAHGQLAQAGFTVHGHLADGIGAWRDAGYPLAKIGEISVEELHRRLAAGEDLRVIDVREAWEYEQVHMEQAELLPLSQLQQWVGALPRDRALVFVCRSGQRSGRVVELMYRLGMRRSMNMVGGMLHWQQCGLPVA